MNHPKIMKNLINQKNHLKIMTDDKLVTQYPLINYIEYNDIFIY